MSFRTKSNRFSLSSGNGSPDNKADLRFCKDYQDFLAGNKVDIQLPNLGKGGNGSWE